MWVEKEEERQVGGAGGGEAKRQREKVGKNRKKTDTHVVGQEDLAELDDVRVEQPRVVDELAADVLFFVSLFLLKEGVVVEVEMEQKRQGQRRRR